MLPRRVVMGCAPPTPGPPGPCFVITGPPENPPRIVQRGLAAGTGGVAWLGAGVTFVGRMLDVGLNGVGEVGEATGGVA